MRVLFRPEAREHVIQARDWYEKQSSGPGSEFVRALEAAIAAASRTPDAFPSTGGDFRRVLLGRFLTRSCINARAIRSLSWRAFTIGATHER